MLAREDWPEWTCPVCSSAFCAPRVPQEPRCPSCLTRAAGGGALPSGDRSRVLLAAKVPSRALEFDESLARWADDPREGRVPTQAWTGDPWCVYLWGANGNGKTHLAVELLWRAHLRGQSIAFVTAGDLVRSAFARVGTLTDRACRVGCLAIDEVSRDLGSPQAVDVVFRIVNHRYAHRLPTLFTSKIPVAAKAPKPSLYQLSTDLADRIQVGLVVRLQGTSMRR